MAAVTKDRPVSVSPPGYEFNDFGYATEDINAGDPVVITGSVPPSGRWEQSLAKATAADACGLALKDVKAGGTCEYGIVGEMDGFTGLSRGTLLTIVSGKLDTTAPANTQVGAAQIRVVTPTRIRFNLV